MSFQLSEKSSKRWLAIQGIAIDLDINVEVQFYPCHLSLGID